MKILLQNVYVISPGSEHHLKEKDILIEDGIITGIDLPNKMSADGKTIISGKNLCVSSGWFDLHVNFGEPGFEFKEDIESGCTAAAQGGFTGVLVMPSTDPPVSGRPSVEYILSRAVNSPVSLYAAGTISDRHEGKELSEMYDMFRAGAKVFTDDKKAIHDSGLMTRALLYSKHFGAKIFSFAEDKSLSGHGIVNEGISATSLGMKGIPSIAEEVMISRDLTLAEYTDAPIHFSTVSTRNAVDLIRKAKLRGLKVTADVSASHLMLDDSYLNSFDTVFKLKPPLRTADDKQALLEGLADGTIDCITSDHNPQDTENKRKEFELASFGAAGLETAFGVARTATEKILSLPELVSKFTTHPRMCAGLKTELIEKNHTADLTVFNSEITWKVEDANLKSKSRNNPFIGMTLKGKPFAIINRNKIVYSS